MLYKKINLSIRLCFIVGLSIVHLQAEDNRSWFENVGRIYIAQGYSGGGATLAPSQLEEKDADNIRSVVAGLNESDLVKLRVYCTHAYKSYGWDWLYLNSSIMNSASRDKVKLRIKGFKISNYKGEDYFFTSKSNVEFLNKHCERSYEVFGASHYFAQPDVYSNTWYKFIYPETLFKGRLEIPVFASGSIRGNPKIFSNGVTWMSEEIIAHQFSTDLSEKEKIVWEVKLPGLLNYKISSPAGV